MLSYKGFYGSISEICKTFYKDYKTVMRLAETQPIEKAIEQTKSNTPVTCKQKQIDNIAPLPNFLRLDEEDRTYAITNIDIIENFIQERHISDEDMQQNLYVQYLYAVTKTNAYMKRYYRRLLIKQRLRQTYIILFRKQYICKRNTVLVNAKTILREKQERNVYDIEEQIAEKVRRETIKHAISLLTPRKQRIINAYYGLNENEPKTFNQIGKELNVTLQRAKYIHDEALRDLRSPRILRKLKLRELL